MFWYLAVKIFALPQQQTNNIVL